MWGGSRRERARLGQRGILDLPPSMRPAPSAAPVREITAAIATATRDARGRRDRHQCCGAARVARLLVVSVSFAAPPRRHKSRRRTKDRQSLEKASGPRRPFSLVESLSSCAATHRFASLRFALLCFALLRYASLRFASLRFASLPPLPPRAADRSGGVAGAAADRSGAVAGDATVPPPPPPPSPPHTSPPHGAETAPPALRRVFG